MTPTPPLRALAACALMIASLAQAHQAQERPPTAQQVQKAQQDRSAVERYLQREEAAATGNRSDATARANSDASVADEAGAASSDPRRTGMAGNAAAGASGGSGNAGNARADAPGPAYGPVLGTRPAQPANPASGNPSGVHDETDRLMRDPANGPTQQPAQTPTQQPSQQQQSQRQSRRNTARHAAWQPANEPMAPRPLRASTVADSSAAAQVPVPVAPPAVAPQPPASTSTQMNSCRGGACTDANGATVNGIGNGNAGVNGAGRLCSRTGTTVQCL